MNTFLFSFIFIPILGVILLGINFLLAPHNPYKEKKTPFECGYHSFLDQSRVQFTIVFFIFGLLFMIFDLELVIIYPYAISSSNNEIFGLWSFIIFGVILTVGFIFELGKNALSIDTKEKSLLNTKNNEVKKIN